MGDCRVEIKAYVCDSWEKIYVVKSHGDVSHKRALEDFRSLLLQAKMMMGAPDFLLYGKYETDRDGMKRQGAFFQFFTQSGHPSRLVSLALPDSKFTEPIRGMHFGPDGCGAKSGVFHPDARFLVFSPYDLDRILTAVAIYSRLLALDNTGFGDRSLLLAGPLSSDHPLELYSDFSTGPGAARLDCSVSLVKALLPMVPDMCESDALLRIDNVHSNASLIDVSRGVIRGVVSASSFTNPCTSSRFFMRIEVHELLARLCTISIGGGDTIALDIGGYPCLS
ncbi:MAG: hypothetical protein Q4B35_04495 [Slackia sp.]|nr:hypothetical protein [Slackia sp.]